MNAKPALARVVLTLLAGMLFWSSWSLQTTRLALPPGTIPYLQYKAFEKAVGAPALPKRQWKKLPAADQRQKSQRLKVQMSQRLSSVLADPAQIKSADVEAVKVAWGADSSKMLAMLRQSSN
jgi:hypothetical protein